MADPLYPQSSASSPASTVPSWGVLVSLQNICAISWNFVFFDTIFSVVNFPGVGQNPSRTKPLGQNPYTDKTPLGQNPLGQNPSGIKPL